MKNSWWVAMAVLLPLFAQAQNRADREVQVTRQCSAIREIVYDAWHHHFANLQQDQVRSSNGYNSMDNWRFTTTRYNTRLLWPEAANSYLEHYEQQSDSLQTDCWQYIAETGQPADMVTAQKFLKQLNEQIDGCSFPLNDSIDLSFKQLPFDSLPLHCPSELQMASLYVLPMTDTSSFTRRNICIMAGIEKKGTLYRVSLIVDDTRVKLLGRKPD